jgi:hypothetical protein
MLFALICDVMLAWTNVICHNNERIALFGLLTVKIINETKMTRGLDLSRFLFSNE